MATPRAVVLSNPPRGGALAPDLLDAITAAPPTEIIVAGGLGREGEFSRESALGRALSQAAAVTVLAGPEDAPLTTQQGRQRLAERLGRKDLSFGEELRPGLLGRRLLAADGVAWVVTSAGLDPTEGRDLGELLAWSQLRSFVRAFARQLEMKRQLPPAEGPYQLTAQALARAIVEVARGREEKAMGDLSRFLEVRGEPGAEVLPILQRAELLLREAFVQRVRGAADDLAVAVVVGYPLPHEADEDAPQVVLTGAADATPSTWVEIALGDRLRVQLRGLRPLAPPSILLQRQPAPPKIEPAPAEVPATTPPEPPPPAQVPVEEGVQMAVPTAGAAPPDGAPAVAAPAKAKKSKKKS